MLNATDIYNKWLSYDALDVDLKKQLEEIKDNQEEINERFYCDLSFGTAGLRGIIGAGTNRMNIYTVKRATQGLADVIVKEGETAKKRGVAIAYDSRLYSDKFAKEAALVLAANGIKVYLFDELRPTPELSFTIRHLNCISGIIITASHNPAKYNGYKVYWEDGAQMPPEFADKVLENIKNTDIFEGVKSISEQEAINSGLLTIIGEEVDKAYLENVYAQSINKDLVKKIADDFKIVYTPFHGAGNKLVRKILEMIGVKNVYVVKEQEMPDPAFPTVISPNPENPEGFSYATKLANKVDCSFIIGTDPDSDRVGVMVRNPEGEFIPISGNQMGVLLVNYVLSQRHKKGLLPENPVVIKTIVTTELTDRICEKYGIDITNVLTGFKFIGEVIKGLEEKGEEKRFVFGYEESYGYLSGSYARDKDAVVASMLIAEMAAFYADRNMTLYDGLVEIYEEFGYYKELQHSVTLEGMEGIKKIAAMMQHLKDNPIEEVDGEKVIRIDDYSKSVTKDMISGKTDKISLPKSDVLAFYLPDNKKFIIRPSGTEPKIKFYFFAKGKDQKDANAIMDKLSKAVLDITGDLLK
ncbi:MAG: phospho-sugar mutase [Clostridia bacterium]|nr:phospho-sugar mutase [Clostridia bacterium]